ncbi:thioredoxin reductase glit [Hyaloscypha variabilis F]|uniref:Thioredoxin reductase glit n=1 Tax=Hyaloscypha variabilis (strain UAMH 11265 / GT02V1 / F) TaxID=1149755 RepID=A0A2J6QUN6_HYAVF|nr:thioredoxin reductase glit [Hyaloscypha variabilis F]
MPAKFNADVLIIGAGPAGLSLVTGLVRQQYTAILFDSGVYRNANATQMHNVIAHDHQAPSSFRAQARASILDRYSGVEFKNSKIENVRKLDSGFEVTNEKGDKHTGRKLVLAVGVKDEMPSLPGYEALWGTRIFHCLFCHGYEARGANSAGVLAVPDLVSAGIVMHIVKMALRLVPNVTVYTNGDSSLGEEVATASGQRKSSIKVNNTKIAKVEAGLGESGVILHMEDGSQIAEGFLVHNPKYKINGPFAEQLGLEMTERGDIKTVGMFGETSVQGVYAIGDCAVPMKSVTMAVASGTACAGGLSMVLQG